MIIAWNMIPKYQIIMPGQTNWNILGSPPIQLLQGSLRPSYELVYNSLKPLNLLKRQTFFQSLLRFIRPPSPLGTISLLFKKTSRLPPTQKRNPHLFRKIIQPQYTHIQRNLNLEDPYSLQES